MDCKSLMRFRVMQLTEYGYTYEIVTGDTCWIPEAYRSVEFQIQLLQGAVWVPLDKNQSLAL